MDRGIRLRGSEDMAGVRRHRPDYWLLILATAMLSIGLVVIYAIGPALALENNVGQNYFANKQLLAIALSFIGFFVAANVPLATWRRLYKPLLIISALATAVALVMPVNVQYPAHRWIRLGPLSFQTVDLLTFAVLLWIAVFLAKRVKLGEITNSRATLIPLVGVLVLLGIVVVGIQSDLGSTGVIVVMMAAMAYVAGMPFRRIMIIGAVIAFGLVIAISTSAYRRARFETFIHPDTNCTTTGYQVCQSLISVGTGGLTGQGLGSGAQAYGYVPEAANDSIFAIYAEKFGFIGTTALLALYLAFFARLKRVAERIPDTFLRLSVIGVLVWFSVQALINIGAMIGLLPLKGITLPFISYGGTSVVFSMAAVGFVFQVSRYTLHQPADTTEGKGYEDRADGRRVRRAYNPAASSRP